MFGHSVKTYLSSVITYHVRGKRTRIICKQFRRVRNYNIVPFWETKNPKKIQHLQKRSHVYKCDSNNKIMIILINRGDNCRIILSRLDVNTQSDSI